MCRADNALATGDCARRAREVTLKKAQEDNMKLKSDTEVGFHHFSNPLEISRQFTDQKTFVACLLRFQGSWTSCHRVLL